jgi:hypothetical protein
MNYEKELYDIREKTAVNHLKVSLLKNEEDIVEWESEEQKQICTNWTKELGILSKRMLILQNKVIENNGIFTDNDKKENEEITILLRNLKKPF